MTSVFVDTTIFLYAQGRPHPLRENCRRFLADCQEHGHAIHVSVEALQEFTFHRLRSRPRSQVLAEARALQRSLVIHPFDADVLDEMLALMEVSPVRGRDAVHAATAIVAGFAQIVSTDSDFVSTPGLQRVDPWQG